MLLFEQRVALTQLGQLLELADQLGVERDFRLLAA
jgi:hypothetical protein